MVLGTKSEERIKVLLKEYIDERRQTIDNQVTTTTTGIFLWGFLSGIVVAYTGVWPFLIGTTVGYCTAKRDHPAINNIYQIGTETITNGYQRLANFLAEK